VNTDKVISPLNLFFFVVQEATKVYIVGHPLSASLSDKAWQPPVPNLLGVLLCVMRGVMSKVPISPFFLLINERRTDNK